MYIDSCKELETCNYKLETLLSHLREQRMLHIY